MVISKRLGCLRRDGRWAGASATSIPEPDQVGPSQPKPSASVTPREPDCHCSTSKSDCGSDRREPTGQGHHEVPVGRHLEGSKGDGLPAGRQASNGAAGGPSPLAGLFRATFLTSGRALLVRVHGDIDLVSEAQFRLALLEALRAADGIIELDMAEVSFIGARGLRLLHGAAEGAAGMGIGLRIVRASDVVRRAAGLAGLDHLFY